MSKNLLIEHDQVRQTKSNREQRKNITDWHSKILFKIWAIGVMMLSSVIPMALIKIARVDDIA